MTKKVIKNETKYQIWDQPIEKLERSSNEPTNYARHHICIQIEDQVLDQVWTWVMSQVRFNISGHIRFRVDFNVWNRFKVQFNENI